MSHLHPVSAGHRPRRPAASWSAPTSSSHLLDQRGAGVEPHLAAQPRRRSPSPPAGRRSPRRRRARTPRPALTPGERRVRAHRNRGAQSRDRSAPSGRTGRRTRRRPGTAANRGVDRFAVGIAELAAAAVAADDDALQPVRPAQRLGGGHHVAGVDARPDVRGGERDAGWSSSAVPAMQFAPSAAKPNRRPSVRSSATSPGAPWPKVKFSPTITAATCSRSTSTSCTNSSGGSRDSSGVNGSTQNTSTPSPSTSSALRRNVVSCAGWLPGRTTSDGCGSKVTTTLGSPRSAASRTARLISSWCPRCTPSNTPMVTHAAPQLAGQVVQPTPPLHGTLDPLYGRRTGSAAGSEHDAPRAVAASSSAARASAAAVGREQPVDALDPGRGQTRWPWRTALSRRCVQRRGAGTRRRRRRRGPGTARASPRAGPGCARRAGRTGRPWCGAAPQVPADAERRAEVAGQRTDVGAGRALDDRVELDAVVLVAQRPGRRSGRR